MADAKSASDDDDYSSGEEEKTMTQEERDALLIKAVKENDIEAA